MKKLALSDEILLKIDKPARYLGNEINAVMKDKNKVDIRFAMCFPDVYEIGRQWAEVRVQLRRSGEHPDGEAVQGSGAGNAQRGV